MDALKQCSERAAQMINAGTAQIANLWENRADPKAQGLIANATCTVLTTGTVAIAILFAWEYIVIGVAAGTFLAAVLDDFECLAGYTEQFNTFFDSLRTGRAPVLQAALDSAILVASYSMPAVTAGLIGLRLGTALDKMMRQDDIQPENEVQSEIEPNLEPFDNNPTEK